MSDQRPKRKGLFRSYELIVLVCLILATFLFVVSVTDFKTIKKDIRHWMSFGPEPALFSKNQKVQLNYKVHSNADTDYKNWIGTIKDIKLINSADQPYYAYTIYFNKKNVLENVREDWLRKPAKPLFKDGRVAQLNPKATLDLDGYDLTPYRSMLATIITSHDNHASGGGYKYDIILENGLSFVNIAEDDLRQTHDVKLSSQNTAAQNNDILRAAFEHARQNPDTILYLPEGDFLLGTDTPDKDYQLLPSDTQIIGNNTVFKIIGKAYWFGIATGPEASDGVRNFTMKNITFEAKDLVKGASFMIMTNHGEHWNISNNIFRMVQPMSGHVFDLGGLQNSLFDNNQFYGYAPELTDKTTIPEGKEHNFYAEAIQLDQSGNNGIWDASLIKNIDPTAYENFNQTNQKSANITISNNKFMPYKDQNGKIIAYAPSIGQHSSEVGKTIVINNVFESPLVNRVFDGNWVFTPIHFPPNSPLVSYGNMIS
ncbi:HlyD family secretion protein [Streptococcus pluranimalium]